MNDKEIEQKEFDEDKFWELEKKYNLSLDNENYDDLIRFAKEYYSLSQSHMKQKAKELIGQHNARIINEYQNKYLGLNGKALFEPIQKVTKQTLSALNNL